MKYTEKPEKPISKTPSYGVAYYCNHPLYSCGTLYMIEFGGKGLVIIQQKFDVKHKYTWWGPVEDWLVDQLYLQPGFKEYFDRHAEPRDAFGLFPTECVRSVMRALKMPPLRKSFWETRF